MHSMWLAVWMRAVIVPAARRAVAVWAGAAIVGAVVFGGNGMRPHDLTSLALRAPAVGAVLATTWLLLFVPSARLLVRWDAASYLRALPGPRIAPIAVAAAAFVVLQLPWLVLWLVGEHALGGVIVLAMSLPIAGVAAWRRRPVRASSPRWRSATRALAGVYVRALVRRAGHALVRGAGLAVLAGVVAGLLVRNNALAGAAAATVGATAIVIVLVPGWAGALAAVVDAHRASAWLAATLGVSEAARVAVLAGVVAGVYVAGAAIAAVAASLVLGEPSLVVPAALAAAASTALVATRLLVWADRSDVARAVRVVVATVIASAACVLALGVLGAVGLAANAAIGVLVLATVKP